MMMICSNSHQEKMLNFIQENHEEFEEEKVKFLSSHENNSFKFHSFEDLTSTKNTLSYF